MDLLLLSANQCTEFIADAAMRLANNRQILIADHIGFNKENYLCQIKIKQYFFKFQFKYIIYVFTLVGVELSGNE